MGHIAFHRRQRSGSYERKDSGGFSPAMEAKFFFDAWLKGQSVVRLRDTISPGKMSSARNRADRLETMDIFNRMVENWQRAESVA